jgi:hypothetical protein
MRFRAENRFLVHCLETRTDLVLEDLGEGGFSVRAAEPFPVGSVMRFNITTVDGSWAALFSAQAVHHHEEADSAGRPVFVTGMKFLHTDNPRVAASIHAFVDRATAIISFS